MTRNPWWTVVCIGIVAFNLNAARAQCSERCTDQPAQAPESAVYGGSKRGLGHVVELPVYYTGGLLPAGENELPRDYDLDVVQAVVLACGPPPNGGFGVTNFGSMTPSSRMTLCATLNEPSSCSLTVLRSLPTGGHVLIRVDLDRAVRDPSERILVKAGDTLILEKNPVKPCAAAKSAGDCGYLPTWTTQIMAKEGEDRLEIHKGDGNRTSRKKLALKMSDGGRLKLTVAGNQVRVHGETFLVNALGRRLEATADGVGTTENKDSLILGGHVRLKYGKGDQQLKVTGDWFAVVLAEGEIRIQPKD